MRRSYRRNRWSDQPRRIEVWSEKGTVRGTLAPVLQTYGVSFRVMHGYGSATAINDVSDQTWDMEQPLIVLYVGDHDPSGRHMSDLDLPDRLDRYSANVEVRRVALVENQLRGLPSFPASDKAGDSNKKGDSRYSWFVSRHGDRCCELDALSPVVLRDTVEEHIRGVIDFELWDHHEAIEEVEFESLQVFADSLRGSRA